jgi:hypothetical protein
VRDMKRFMIRRHGALVACFMMEVRPPHARAHRGPASSCERRGGRTRACAAGEAAAMRRPSVCRARLFWRGRGGVRGGLARARDARDAGTRAWPRCPDRRTGVAPAPGALAETRATPAPRRPGVARELRARVGAGGRADAALVPHAAHSRGSLREPGACGASRSPANPPLLPRRPGVGRAQPSTAAAAVPERAP